MIGIFKMDEIFSVYFSIIGKSVATSANLIHLNHLLVRKLIFYHFFQELQNEVSSLLEFKNALLETFPHLQSRFSTPTNQPQTRGSHTPVYGVGRRDHRPGYLLSHAQPYSPTRY